MKLKSSFLLMLFFISSSALFSQSIYQCWSELIADSTQWDDYKGPNVQCDAQGNAYFASAHDSALVIVKYSAAGDMLWQQNFDSTNSTFHVLQLSIDSFNQVWVLANWLDNVFPINQIVLKYNESGNLVWHKTITNAYYNAIAFDHKKNFFLGGFNYITDKSSVIKFDSAGNQLWETGETDDKVDIMQCDDSGNIYCSGEKATGGYGNTDVSTRKFDAAGNAKWYQGFDGNTHDKPMAIRSDHQGNIYIAVVSHYFGYNNEMNLLKYDSTGILIWNKYFPTFYDALEMMSITGMDIDSLNNIYLGLNIPESYIIKYQPNGQLQWLQQFPTDSSYLLRGMRMRADQGGNSYASGTTFTDILCIGGCDSSYITTYKLNSSGNSVWVIENHHSSGVNQVLDLALDEQSNVFITGYAVENDSLNFITIKYCGECSPTQAEFSFSDSAQTFHFHDASVNATSWLWSFGDGTTDTLQNPMHTYALPA